MTKKTDDNTGNGNGEAKCDQGSVHDVDRAGSGITAENVDRYSPVVNVVSTKEVLPSLPTVPMAS